ncbi:hypothetical protein XENORESO_020060 [Xenotaenia resolanae]|uniref:Uncharacterized protein n=1 Tax=Xenotaenia resolanae TaxID=208358 RepID=A0ABV0WZI7_9TELE
MQTADLSNQMNSYHGCSQRAQLLGMYYIPLVLCSCSGNTYWDLRGFNWCILDRVNPNEHLIGLLIGSKQVTHLLMTLLILDLLQKLHSSSQYPSTNQFLSAVVPAYGSFGPFLQFNFNLLFSLMFTS